MRPTLPDFTSRDDLAIVDDHEVHFCPTIVVSPIVEVVVLVECIVEFGQYEVCLATSTDALEDQWFATW